MNLKETVLSSLRDKNKTDRIEYNGIFKKYTNNFESLCQFDLFSAKNLKKEEKRRKERKLKETT